MFVSNLCDFCCRYLQRSGMKRLAFCPHAPSDAVRIPVIVILLLRHRKSRLFTGAISTLPAHWYAWVLNLRSHLFVCFLNRAFLWNYHLKTSQQINCWLCLQGHWATTQQAEFAKWMQCCHAYRLEFDCLWPSIWVYGGIRLFGSCGMLTQQKFEVWERQEEMVANKATHIWRGCCCTTAWK